MFPRRVLICLLTTLVAPQFVAAAPIDRHALVSRHNPTVTAIDKSAPFMVGNGNLAFTADITGLQTFPEQYSTLVPLMTQAQWAWHSFPNPKGFTLAQAEVPIKVRGKKQKYPYLSDWEQAKRPEVQWLRENPHRFSLGRLGLYLANTGGKPAAFSDLSATRQSLDMWTGRLSSSFVFDGVPVEVETSVHPDRDLIIVRLRSNLLADGRLGVDLRFPGVSAKLNPDPADWQHPESHTTTEIVAQRRWSHARAAARRHPIHRAGGVGSRARHCRSRGALVPAHGARFPAAHLVSGVFRGGAAGADAECGSGAECRRPGLGKVLDAWRRGRLHRQQRSARP